MTAVEQPPVDFLGPAAHAIVADDAAARTHFETHTVDEWAATLADLRIQLTEARKETP
ncbi:hypothetical protein ABT336_12140 [Micromonospora sp. NPDC000207]|uniref:hypothetical protein n=1 Tax=Micromonospora sp. NPDC000207 TaxID=3154246 RepID=UPI003323C9A8